MSKMSGRINRIVKKTHVFISGADFRLKRDSSKAKLDEQNANPEDYHDGAERLKLLWDEYQKDYSQEKLELWKEEIGKHSLAAYYAFCYRHESEMCTKWPNGLWMRKEGAEKWMHVFSDARDYFKRKKS